MDRIRIVGGNKLNGTIPIFGRQDAALPLMIARLRTRGHDDSRQRTAARRRSPAQRIRQSRRRPHVGTASAPATAYQGQRWHYIRWPTSSTTPPL